MQYGININFFVNMLGMEKAAQFISRAGFTKLDYTPFLIDDDWRLKMKEAVNIFNNFGLEVHQTHAPFNRYGRYGKSFKLYLDRCAEATAILEAEYLVAHGDEFDFENMEFSSQAALEYNHSIYLPIVQKGEKCGFKVAFETVFEDGSGLRRFTSKEDELYNLITSFKSENSVCCWDSGHANISFSEEAPDIIRKFGSLIQCTHIHDNSGNDSHQLPMTGKIDWKLTMDAFKDINYQGVTSVEYSCGSLPQDLLEDYINLTYASAKKLWLL